VQLGQRTILPNVTLRVGALTEQVEVVAAQPTVDMWTVAIGASLDSEFLSRVPVQRRVSDVVYLAPGVSSGGLVGEANPSISGASGLENQYVIDGVNISNSGYGRDRLLLDRVRLAWHGRALRLRSGSASQDGRIRGRVWPGDGQHRAGSHEDWRQPFRRQRLLVLAARAVPG
jgi:hypothetical protein